MNINLNVNISSNQLYKLLEGQTVIMDGITSLLINLERMEEAMSRISDEVQESAALAAQTSSAIDAVTGLVTTLLQQVEDNIGDETALQEVLTVNRANLAKLAAAAQAGTQPIPPITDPGEDSQSSGEDTTTAPEGDGGEDSQG